MQAKNIIILAPDYSEVNRFLKFDVNLQADNQNNSANSNTATYRYATFINLNQGDPSKDKPLVVRQGTPFGRVKRPLILMIS